MPLQYFWPIHTGMQLLLKPELLNFFKGYKTHFYENNAYLKFFNFKSYFFQKKNGSE